jgi:cytidine deaminase
MREKLTKLLDNSYAKYSKYRVSCICVMKDGKEISGVNVENASYGATICAERVAITSAIASGYKKKDFKELHVMVDSDKIGTPCFMCRQVIREFFDENDKVIVYSRCNTKSYKVVDLCPHPFTEENL